MFKGIIKIFILVLIVFVTVSPAWSAEQKTLEKILFETSTATTDTIVFKLNGPHIPKIFALKGDRPRVVFDFFDTRPARVLKNTVNTNGKFVQRIRMGIHYEPAPKTRIVFDLLLDKKIDFKQHFDKKNNTLTISVFQAGKEPVELVEPVILKSDAKASPKVTPPSKKKSASIKPQPENKKSASPKKTSHKKDKPKTDIKKSKPDTPKKPHIPPEPKVKPVTPLTIPSPAPAPVKDTKINKKKTVDLPVNKKATKKKQTKKHEQKQKPATAAVPERPILKSVSFDKKSNRGEMVLFRLNTFQAPIVFGVEEGQPRVVCDFKETDAGKKLPEKIAVNGKFIHTIRISKESDPKKIRVVLDLASSMSFDLQQVFFKKENLFVLIINAQGKTTPRKNPKTQRK